MLNSINSKASRGRSRKATKLPLAKKNEKKCKGNDFFAIAEQSRQSCRTRVDPTEFMELMNGPCPHYEYHVKHKEYPQGMMKKLYMGQFKALAQKKDPPFDDD